MNVETSFSEITKDCSQPNGETPGGPFTTEDLIAVIRNLKRRKAPGPYLITYEHFIFGCERVVQALFKLFNTIVLQGRIYNLFIQRRQIKNSMQH